MNVKVEQDMVRHEGAISAFLGVYDYFDPITLLVPLS
jgi:hypothetical protein